MTTGKEFEQELARVLARVIGPEYTMRSGSSCDVFSVPANVATGPPHADAVACTALREGTLECLDGGSGVAKVTAIGDARTSEAQVFRRCCITAEDAAWTPRNACAAAVSNNAALHSNTSQNNHNPIASTNTAEPASVHTSSSNRSANAAAHSTASIRHMGSGRKGKRNSCTISANVSGLGAIFCVRFSA